MEIGEGNSLLNEFLGKEALSNENSASEVAQNENNSEETIFNDEVSKGSLLFDFIAKDNESQDSSTPNYKSQYDENVKSGKWVEVEGADDIEWSEDSFKKIEEAQRKTSSEPSQEDEPVSTSSDVEFRKGRIKALGDTDFNDVDNAKELVRLYRIQQEGEDKSASIDKQIAVLDDEEVIQYAKTISAKIVKEDETYIKGENEAEAKAQEDNWKQYESNVIEAGSKLKLSPAESKKKLEQVKSGEFNKQLWATITDPEKFHKVFDFLMDIDKYEEKIKAKTNSKLVVEAITKKNINTETPKTNFGKINIAI
jgi:hypothetical protein